MERAFRGKAIVGGNAEGEVLVSRRAFTFAHGVNPSTGEVTDIRSDIRGGNVRGKVLVYPFGKGSTTASSWFLEAVRAGNPPGAIVTESTDLSSVIGSVIAKTLYGVTIPVVSSLPEEFYRSAKSGNRAQVRGDTGEVVLSW